MPAHTARPPLTTHTALAHDAAEPQREVPRMPADWSYVAPLVPDAYLGVWKRASYVDERHRDETTLRYWLQTPDWHADLGVSAQRPSFEGVTSLAECSSAQLDWLCKGQGFAGPTRISGELCFWDRQWDFQLRDTRDIGHMRFTSESLIEDDIHQRYREVWCKLPRAENGERALEGHRPGDPQILLLASGGYFMYMRDRALRAAPACRAKRQFTEGAATRSEQEAFADFEMSFGRYDAEQWTIELSTLPWREGRSVACDSAGLPDIAALTGGRAKAWRPLERHPMPSAKTAGHIPSPSPPPSPSPSQSQSPSAPNGMSTT
ncbi:hypothetical protein [Pararobbsia alpina]|uniref:Uncharacterized protein n=1 Tax=Pararobbsia alpina TaxID=621374 RepID=A0A6S7BDC4_9BURK|nr:hypothetical protein [Pararobbsia alpina]CAB3796367.1 hypothetical protein LMG28138_04066 [Pararobbsia alpina]